MTCATFASLCPLYLCNELDTQLAREFVDHLHACESCANRLEEQTRLDSVLRDSVLSEPLETVRIDDRIRSGLPSFKPSLIGPRWMAAVVAAAAMLVVGTLAYRHSLQTATPRLCLDAALDYNSEILLAAPRKWLSNVTEIQALAERDGISGSLLTALAPAGYHLDRGKRCRLDGRVFLHLVYSRDGSKFSVYLRPSDDRALSGEIAASESGKRIYRADSARQHIAYFQTHQLTALFVTGETPAVALSLADSAARIL